jgi:hypothetical protein
MKTDYNNKLTKMLDQSDMDAAQKLVFMWVKQGLITPDQMAMMVIAAYKKFAYNRKGV